MPILEARLADITRVEADAIVNAANESLLGGGGVDGAIHRAAGADLLEACRGIAQVRPGVRCPTGEARITPGFALPARYVIHTVGPVWRGGGAGEAEALAACYRNSLALAASHGLQRIAFPAISCGVYGYPPDAAVAIAVQAVRAFDGPTPAQVLFCCHDRAMLARYEAALRP
ncbi:O-acetyl-ADP-ribose deacetylase [Luteimonas chenhongjianii]|uniref:O-acetyl-ADP-ribose deacetylase n=1 Tax=Luteimonas chenhongjianii TaxID=2006110 RepID=A0A290XHI0_9GAMM|nr:O-acetyl-ADP-ribose deacetylase [Luteimonas chenhongjianii]ATD68396.1 O-acetyl-ADP-ribose deacetylase [Luteimonas chenhongjianii]